MSLLDAIKKMQSSRMLVLSLGLFAMLLLQGCFHRTKVMTCGTHQVTLSRVGFASRYGLEEHDNVAIFRYDGVNMAGQRLHIEIHNDEVILNGQSRGMLKKGDSVFISDDGLAVNSMDYGESERYLAANSKSEEAALPQTR